jgi:acetyl-CoA C-acetyltransferase
VYYDDRALIMTEPTPSTPIIVGVGFYQEHADDPRQSLEAYRLMERAVRLAAADAGANALLSGIESISIPQGLWQYRNPGKLVGEALGCPNTTTVVSDLGVLQLTLLSDLCRAVAAGAQQIGVIVGGEAKYRDLRAKITGQSAPETQQDEQTPLPDVRHNSADPFCSDLEAQRGLMSPAELFAIIESSLRHHQGLGVEEHRDAIARLYSEFSRIAAANPDAWRREPIAAEDIRNPTAKNSMLAFPYTKLHCSQWNVNQAVAILVCSAEKARALGLDEKRWIYPLSSVQSRHVVVLAQQRQLHSHLGTVLSGKRALALAGATTREVEAAELYSCFPAAIRSFAHDLELEGVCPWTVTGSMAFGGGPFNHASLAGVAKIVEVLRSAAGADSRTRHIGLVSNLSGIFGKQGCALFANLPNEDGYRFEDITEIVAAQDVPVPIDAAYTGPATVVGYTVVYAKESPSHAIAICDTPAGNRTVARCADRQVLDTATREELCGRTVRVEPDGSFSL